MADLAGSAFVSGGSSGIGYAVAARLLESGYGVTVASRRRDRLLAAAGSLRELGVVHHAVADFADHDDILAAVGSHSDRFGGMDILVNNAGVGVAGPIESLSTKDLDRQLDVNLRGYMIAISAAMPRLLEAEHAHIFNIASIAGLRGQGGLAAYSAAKAGIVGATEALHEELGARGIKVTAICPSFVDTPMARWAAEEFGPEKLIPQSDVVDILMAILALSPRCTVPIVPMEPPGGLGRWSSEAAIDLAARIDARS